MAEDFVDMCAVCKQGVPRASMVYQKGKVFHTQCFADHGSSFPAPNHELNHLSARTRVELVQLKNLKARDELEKQAAKESAKEKRKKPKKKSKKRPAKKPKTQRRKKKAKVKSAKRRTKRR
ncbi:MAG: hypothetical protein QXE84_06845 [Candidatus Nitrosotenuis sp.]|uniref:Uncharacterized protein n=1 Tax=Candidatus Nitrosotenuis uzonensis TaxID=1407055 RepID=A0A812EY94_9ARCH|nr:hypothetical protein [Candidatus Nitrosotenuis uzonensis]CAE6501960.1 conserved hypothetical protein [Candidatus Nitrosotenuis uzonensis]